ncbi:hypothetical protein EV702DRAFT_767960 [Suillus placidus]|uniref:Uncharacterized protein n=1 Tax=Suillus placidus TaxID=48579 RepID=A0A9P7A1T7_9AGAM|nr:hypothetical protein EV702DRAFT_767960 [Suillus placidus]
MADLRPGVTKWTDSDLEAYHITVSSQTKKKFFGVPHLPPPAHPALVDYMDLPDRRTMSSSTRKLLWYCDLANSPGPGQFRTAGVNFFAKLLETYGYNDGRRIVFTHHPLPLPICGVTSVVEMDISVMDDNEILMVVLDLTRLEDIWYYLEPTVIAGAIAAYVANNKVRVNMNLPPLDAITIPAITLEGLTPTFYKIPVTAELSEAVARGTYPTSKTRVLRYFPKYSVHPRSLAFRETEDRAEFLACLEAFKQFLRK